MSDPTAPYLAYFDRDVLASYRLSPDQFALVEDDMGGELSGDHIFLRFAFRRLVDRRVRVALFRPDFSGLPRRDQQRWQGFHTGDEQFADDDPAFQRWVQRNLDGSFEPEDGPMIRIPHHIRVLQAMTTNTLGRSLFRVNENPHLSYPAAENRKAYVTAHAELNSLLADGLVIESLVLLAERVGVKLTKPDKTLNSLKELLPAPLVAKIHGPLKHCSTTRQGVHGVSSTSAAPFAAFDSFHADLVGVDAALEALQRWLEGVLQVSADACLQREDAMRILFPEIVGPPLPEDKVAQLERSVGKTVSSVRIGAVKPHDDLHASEALEIYFTDGTALSISIGSNAQNVTDGLEGLRPHDFHTSIFVFWAPSTSGA